MSHPKQIEKEPSVGNYLKIAEKAKTEIAENAPPPIPSKKQNPTATKATEATKAPQRQAVQEKPARDKSDRSDKRPSQSQPNFTPLTVSEALAEINRWGSGASRNAELYRSGELSEERAVEYVTCAILHCRGESFEVWKHHAPAVRKALALCIHELMPDACAVCSGRVRRMIEEVR